jgi:hypothetical protein
MENCTTKTPLAAGGAQNTFFARSFERGLKLPGTFRGVLEHFAWNKHKKTKA